MRREWRRFGPGIALGAAVLVVGGAAVLAATAGTAGPRASSPASADLAGPLRGPCLFGFIGDCSPSPTPTPTGPPPSSTAATPAPTNTHTTAPSHQPTTAPPRSGHPHRPPTHHSRVRTTVPTAPSSTHHRRSKHSLPVAGRTSVDPTPAGTTLSASDDVTATSAQSGPKEPAGLFRPLMQLFPVVVICLAVGIVVLVGAARRGSRRTRATAGHARSHRHAYSGTDELTHRGAWGNTR